MTGYFAAIRLLALLRLRRRIVGVVFGRLSISHVKRQRDALTLAAALLSRRQATLRDGCRVARPIARRHHVSRLIDNLYKIGAGPAQLVGHLAGSDLRFDLVETLI